MQSVMILIVQACLYVLLAPLFAGWVKWVKCHLQNRAAPPVIQPYRNLVKLFHKQTLLANQASWIFRLTPYLIFTVIIITTLCVPLFSVTADTSIIGDGIVLVGLFALIRFFMALSGLDIGTAFGGMGSSREMMIASMAEPALLLVLFTLAMTASSTNLNSIVLYLTKSTVYLRPSLIFIALAMAMITLAETGRIPVDNPATHLELTMTHEAMILEYTGRHLALIEWTAQIKLLLYVVLFGNLFFPWGVATSVNTHALVIAAVSVFLKSMVLGSLVVVIETGLAKMRLFKVPYFLSIAFSLALVGILIHIILEV